MKVYCLIDESFRLQVLDPDVKDSLFVCLSLVISPV
jgi:hypothetical protein